MYVDCVRQKTQDVLIGLFSQFRCNQTTAVTAATLSFLGEDEQSSTWPPLAAHVPDSKDAYLRNRKIHGCEINETGAVRKTA